MKKPGKRATASPVDEIDDCLAVAVKIRDGELTGDAEKLNAIALIERLTRTRRQIVTAKKAKKTNSHARARTDDRAVETQDRIQVIVDLMSEMRWHPREIKRLAESWGLSESRVRALSAEASRSVAAAMGDLDEIRGQFYTALVGIAERSENQGHPDHNSSTRALMAAADLIGLKATPPTEPERKMVVKIVRYKEEPEAPSSDDDTLA